MSIFSLVPPVPDPFSGESTFHQRVVEGLRSAGHRVNEGTLRGRDGAELRASAVQILNGLPDDTRLVAEGRAVPALVYALPMQRRRLITVATFHRPAYGSTEPQLRDAIFAAERDSYRHVDRVLTTSLHGAMALGPLGVLPDQIGLVLPAVDPTPEARGGDGHSLLMVGRLEPRKGHRWVLEALARVPELRLRIVGSEAHDPSYAAELRREIESSPLSDRVSLAGGLDPRALRGAYDAADLFVAADPAEAAGFAALQALAAGVPVLAASAGGLPKTLPKRGVLWSEPGSVSGLSSVLRRWVDDEPARLYLQEEARRNRGRLRRWTTVHREVVREMEIAEQMAQKGRK